LHVGVDVGGTNTDAVLIDGGKVLASTKQTTSDDVESGVVGAIRALLGSSGLPADAITAVMIGTTQFTNALTERKRLDEVAILRLASPSGEALPPFTAWPHALVEQTGRNVFLLPGGFEVDGREISPFDEPKVRAAARETRRLGVTSVAISSAFAPINAMMEERAARIFAEENPAATLSLSYRIGRLGIVERENGAILNAALISLGQRVAASFERAVRELGLAVPIYISQNDGTLISVEMASRYPVLTIGSGPTNSMRGAAFLTGLRDAIVIDVGGTTSDIGVLASGFPRESSVSIDIGGVRTNFRMPDVLALGLGGGSRIHLDRGDWTGPDLPAGARIGPDSVGNRLKQDACLFGGTVLTASDIAVLLGRANFGERARLPALSPALQERLWSLMQQMLEDGIDRMKTSQGDATVIAVGGGEFLVGDRLSGVKKIVRPQHAEVANAVGAAIAQVGAQIERIVDYDRCTRELTLARLRDEVAAQVEDAGAARETIEIVDVDEVMLSYLPGRSAQVRIKAVGNLPRPTRAAALADSRVQETSHPS
jgi:N-methylhydantoinase A/oxoprolinase/acetone carboxylase beta subunit